MEQGFEKDQDREGPETVDRQSLGGHRSSLDEYHDHINVKGAQISQEWSPRCGPLLSGENRKDAPSIFLPHQSEYVSHIALDIGGSLIKLAYFVRNPLESGGGKLRFEKFETSRIHDCMDFIENKRLHKRRNSGKPMRVKATGGGAFKYAELFRERLGIILEREDEMACMVSGCNFLLQAVRNEAFQYENGEISFIDIDPGTVYPYLLVNIGSGVSMVRVDGEGEYQRISGTNMGGGTFWGLGRLLTGCSSFDEMLELSSHGDNSNVDMLVGDIYGGRDYASIGLSANTIASSFGKVLHSEKNLEDYNPADIAMSLLRMISYNIGQLAYLNAKRYNLSRIFFGGFFIRGHLYTMETISYAIRFWSQGEMGAMFLRHEGFLGAMGAFMRVQAVPGISPVKDKTSEAGKVRARFVEKFSLENSDGEESGQKSEAWVDKFIETVRPATEAAKTEHELALAQLETHPKYSGSEELQSQKFDLHVGVLHFTPTCEPFPLLATSCKYVANTIDINADAAEMAYWVGVLQDQIPTVMEKAASSQQNTKDAIQRAASFGRSLDSYLSKYRSQSSSFGQINLSDLFEVREECLREAGFDDVYRMDKARENAAALEALPDLLAELDILEPPARLLSLVQGVLAANIFDWGAKACVDLYHTATILEMYKHARERLSQRPWRVDDLTDFAEVWLSKSDLDTNGKGQFKFPYRRCLIFVDNAGADVVLGCFPLAREILRGGGEVVLAANSLPAINDITLNELVDVVDRASDICPIMKEARKAAIAAQVANGGRVPPPPGMMQRPSSMTNLSSMLIGNDSSPPSSSGSPKEDSPVPALPSLHSQPRTDAAREPRLYVVENGQGSPCLDLTRVSKDVADATVGTDLVIIEGMGRSIHTNFAAKLKCDVLKLAMIKNKHLASRLFNGNVYECICRFDNGVP
ncbi:hypothetical protein M9434_004874 [Picochlorum sp. BPE23]|nr:hypothetical protein M9434_004874 [Picochlorum sp. BPE23]